MALIFPDHFYSDLLHTNKAQVQVIADASDQHCHHAHQLHFKYHHWLSVRLNKGTTIPSYCAGTGCCTIPNSKVNIHLIPEWWPWLWWSSVWWWPRFQLYIEKELGTMEILLVSPFKPILVILSKFVPHLLISWWTLHRFFFWANSFSTFLYQGSIVLLYDKFHFYYHITLSWLCWFLIKLNHNKLPCLFLSYHLTSYFAVKRIHVPHWKYAITLQIISNIVPSKWFYVIVKSIMIKGSGFQTIWKKHSSYVVWLCFYWSLAFVVLKSAWHENDPLLLQKEFRQIFRNKTLLRAILFAPLMQLMLLPWARIMKSKYCTCSCR